MPPRQHLPPNRRDRFRDVSRGPGRRRRARRRRRGGGRRAAAVATGVERCEVGGVDLAKGAEQRLWESARRPQLTSPKERPTAHLIWQVPQHHLSNMAGTSAHLAEGEANSAPPLIKRVGAAWHLQLALGRLVLAQAKVGAGSPAGAPPVTSQGGLEEVIAARHEELRRATVTVGRRGRLRGGLRCGLRGGGCGGGGCVVAVAVVLERGSPAPRAAAKRQESRRR